MDQLSRCREILLKPEVWQPPDWELRVYVPADCFDRRLHALLGDSRFTGWWAGYGELQEQNVAGLSLVRILDRTDSDDVCVKGVAHIGGNHRVACRIQGMPEWQFREPSQVSLEDLSALTCSLQVDLPSGALAQAIDGWVDEERDEPSDGAFRDVVAPFCRSIARDLVHSGEIRFCYFCHEDVPYVDLGSVTPDLLYLKHCGFILPASHALADSPGGVPFADGWVLFDWDLT